jgi:hypothetical protein
MIGHSNRKEVPMKRKGGMKGVMLLSDQCMAIVFWMRCFQSGLAIITQVLVLVSVVFVSEALESAVVPYLLKPDELYFGHNVPQLNLQRPTN